MTAVQKQKDLLTNRWRTVRAPEPSEFQIQSALIKRLRLQCRPGVTYFAVPNGELRPDKQGAKLKAMGVRPGVSDLIFFWGGPNVLCLELKSRTGSLTPEQKIFRDEISIKGCSFEVAHSIDQAVKILIHHGILPPG